MTDEIERSLQVFDAAALELLWNLLDVPATLSPAAGAAAEMASAVAEARARVNALRQIRRDAAAADAERRRKLEADADQRQRDLRPQRIPRAAGNHR